MADPARGRGRGLALLQALKKTQMMESGSSSSDSPEATPDSSCTPSAAPSVAPSVASTATTIGGRGRIAAMLLAKTKPGTSPVISPASDVSPSPRGAGRGLKLLQSLQASKAAADVGKPIQEVTTKMAESTISDTVTSIQTSATTTMTKSKKNYREVKDTPPVVMKGESGMPVNVTANYIFLKFEENKVYEYEVRYEPDQDYKHLRFKLLGEHSKYFKEKTFDGTTLYVPRQLPDEALNLVSTHPFDNSKVKISIIFRRTRRLSEMIHIYNVIFKCIMKDLQLVRFGRDHFNEHAAVQIPQHKLEVWPGYVTAVDEYEGGLMLTLDSTHRVLRTQTVLSFIQETVQAEGANWKKAIGEQLVGCSVMTTYNKKLFRIDSIDDSMTPRSTFEKLQDGKPVKVSFVDYYKKSYGIDIKDWDQPLLISRDTKRLPGTEKPTDFMICLIPELCQLTGLTDNQRSNFKLMKDVATYTRITPNQRHSAFKKYIQTVLSNETAKSRLTGWGLSIAPDTVELCARTLQPETLYFGRNVKVPGKPTAEWNNDVTKNAVMQAVDIIKWVILHVDRDKQVARDFQETIMRCCKPMGITVAPPDVIRLQNDRTDTYVMTLKKIITSGIQLVVAICPTARDDRYGAIKKICCADNPIPSQVINARTLMNQSKVRAITQKILLQMNCKLGGTLWNINIPYKTAMVIGIDAHHDATRKKQSVCGVKTDPKCPECMKNEETSFHLLAEYPMYSLIRWELLGSNRLDEEDIINLKVELGDWTKWPASTAGGSSVRLPASPLEIIKSKVTITWAVDLSATDGNNKKIRIIGFVASYNQTMTHWYSKAVFQERGQEVADSLKACLVDALKHYLQTNGVLPDRIIIYRDGVGDGQLKLLKEYEIPQLRISFSLLGQEYKPTLTYIVVQKRINTRIFLKSHDGLANPNPGTVLDHTITRRDWYDFLIVSQKVNQGTVTPTHYIVVYDDNNMTPDQCQRLTYKLCHLYYNWPGTVRVPAPCQYAHKLAYLVGQSVHQQPSEVLSDKLFFL